MRISEHARRRLAALFAATVFGWITGSARAAEAPAGTYTYSVVHPVLGDIGTFTNVVSRAGNEVVVDTTVRVAAKLWFVNLRRIEAHRREVWKDGKLSLYDSTTRKDGKVITVHGHAEGSDFLIDGPAGRAEAPATVRPGNPWSIAIVRASLIIAPESGRLYQVRFEGGAEETTAAGIGTVRARHYVASGESRADLWYDANDIPVKFSIVDEGEHATCVLESAPSSGVAERR
jgi:hypothetical protein